MSSWTRKARRKNTVKNKKLAEQDMAQKVKLMGDLPDICLACETQFDKKNKEQVTTWRVVVRENEGKVNLYCPPCWQKAIDIVEGFKKRIEERKNEQSTE